MSQRSACHPGRAGPCRAVTGLWLAAVRGHERPPLESFAWKVRSPGGAGPWRVEPSASLLAASAASPARRARYAQEAQPGQQAQDARGAERPHLGPCYGRASRYPRPGLLTLQRQRALTAARCEQRGGRRPDEAGRQAGGALHRAARTAGRGRLV